MFERNLPTVALIYPLKRQGAQDLTNQPVAGAALLFSFDNDDSSTAVLIVLDPPHQHQDRGGACICCRFGDPRNRTLSPPPPPPGILSPPSSPSRIHRLLLDPFVDGRHPNQKTPNQVMESTPIKKSTQSGERQHQAMTAQQRVIPGRYNPSVEVANTNKLEKSYFIKIKPL